MAVEILEQNRYSWEIPIEVDGESVKITLHADYGNSPVDAGSKLTRETKWSVSFISRDCEKSHLAYLASRQGLEEYDRIIIIGGLQGFGGTMPAVLALRDGEIAGCLLLDFERHGFEEMSPDDNGLYDYEEVMADRRKGIGGSRVTLPQKGDYLVLANIVGGSIIGILLLLGVINVYWSRKNKNPKG